MQLKFNSLLELLDYFKDEDMCKKHLEETRWGDKIICPHCQYEKIYRIKKGFKCSCCKKIFTVTSGTIYHNSRTPLRKWFAAIYLFVGHKKGISSVQLAKDIKVTQKCAWLILHKIRQVMPEKNPALFRQIVESDEAYIGGKNKNRHKDKKAKDAAGRSPKDKTPVLGLIERRAVKGKYTKHVRLFVIPDTQAHTMWPIIKANLKHRTTLVTDAHTAYEGLRKWFNHITVKHSGCGYVDGIFHTNSIENFWSHLKRGIHGTYHTVSRRHLQNYCNEFAFRYNNQTLTDSEKFQKILLNISGVILPYRTLCPKPS